LADSELPLIRKRAAFDVFCMAQLNPKSYRYCPQGELQQQPLAQQQHSHDDEIL